MQKIRERFYWKTLWIDIQEFIQQCEVCQHANDSKFQKSTALLHPIPVKSKVWNQVINKITARVMMFAAILLLKVGIDLIGPLPKTARGNRYIVTLVDYFSKWPEAEPIPDKSAKTVAAFLYRMICRLLCYFKQACCIK